MDILYDNLENYNEEATIAELQNENRDLKMKLEEYTTTIKTIQQDFDKLSADYKTLELNYSSLLKTARAEVERKTQMITQLNTEKDIMVINSVKNGGANILKKRNFSNDKRRAEPKKHCEDSDTSTAKSLMSVKEPNRPHPKRIDSAERKENSHSDNRITSSSTSYTGKLLHIVNKVLANNDSCSERLSSDTKENVSHRDPRETLGHTGEMRSKPLSIKDRRKSMPAACLQAKFSSDDECSIDERRKDFRSFPKKIDRNHSDRLSTITSEPSNRGGQHSGYYESSREAFKRSSRYDCDKRMSSERYQRDRREMHRRPVTPEWKKDRRGLIEYPEITYKRYISSDSQYDRSKYPEDRYQRSEYTRQSSSFPSGDNPYQSQRQSREQWQYDYDRNYQHNYDRDRYWQQEKYSAKHKLPPEDEPSSKRFKPQIHEQKHYDKRWVDEKQSYDQPTPMEPMQLASCQSPDPGLSDYGENSHSPMREIKSTPTSQQDDPRVSSDKYVTENQGNTVLVHTVTGRNVDIKAIDKLLWSMEQMPMALKKPPQECQEKALESVSVEIENPVSNTSMELGEIHTSSTISLAIDVPTSSNPPDETAKAAESKKHAASTFRDKLKTDKTVKNITVEEASQKTFSKYKIPKSQRKENRTDASINESKLREQQEILEKDKSIQAKSLIEQKSVNKLSCMEKETINIKRNIVVEDNKPISQREIVASDLQLSDVSSDNADMAVPESSQSKTKKTRPQNNKGNVTTKEPLVTGKEKEVKMESKRPKRHTNTKDSKRKDQVSESSITNKRHSSEAQNMPSLESKVKEDYKCTKMSTRAQDGTSVDQKKETRGEKAKESHVGDANKRHDKSKRKVHKQKDSNKDETDKPATAPTNKTRTKEQGCSVSDAMKPKFSELFGDSSSLITPEDLGLPAAAPPPAAYVPHFEDALDATDLASKKTGSMCTTVTDFVNKNVDSICTKAAELVNTKSESVCTAATELAIKKPDIICTTATDLANKKSDIICTTGTDLTNKKSNSISTTNTDLDTPSIGPPKTNSDVEAVRDDKITKPVRLPERTNELICLNPVLPEEKCTVTTHIISTGFQPQCVGDAHTGLVTSLPAIRKGIFLKALATSTPNKGVPSVVVAGDCRSAVIGGASFDRGTPADSSDTNTVDSLNETDAPDVRIFVRRRRKIKKPAA